MSNMSKLSDISLIFLIIGTILIVFTLILSLFIDLLFFSFLVSQGIGWIFYSIALILLIITKNKYHIIKVKNNFLKLDHIIIFFCTMSIMITFLIVIDINIYIYTGKGAFITIFVLGFFLLILIKSLLLKKKKKKSNKIE